MTTQTKNNDLSEATVERELTRLEQRGGLEEERETPLDFNNLPILPLYWYILVQPLAIPETTKGGIIKAGTHVRAEEIMTTLGEIMAMGPGACTGKTESGCQLRSAVRVKPRCTWKSWWTRLIYRIALWWHGDSSVSPLEVGDWVLYAKYTGHEIKTKSGHRLLLLGDSDILGYVPDPREIVLW